MVPIDGANRQRLSTLVTPNRRFKFHAQVRHETRIGFISQTYSLGVVEMVGFIEFYEFTSRRKVDI